MTALVPSEAQRVEMLSALVACDGMPKLAAKRLAEQGYSVTWADLKRLREQHAATYQALAVERSRAAEEALTVEYRELARLGQKATRNFLEGLLEYQETTSADELMADRGLPQTIQALGKVMQVSTDKLLALTGRPTDGGNADPLQAAKDLVALGVLKPVERPSLPADVDSTAEEVTST